jgi:cytochrome c peroxidase
MTVQNIAKAISACERTLLTPSPFDTHLAGNQEALSPAARAGLAKFINTGCVTCHNGIGVGGAMYEKFGVVEDYWTATGSDPIDKGRADVTKDPADLYVVAFLESLTGELPADFATAPVLPSGAVVARSPQGL